MPACIFYLHCPLMKQKTHSGTKKRVKITRGGKGKMMLQKACKNHLLSSKNKRQLKSSRLGVKAPAGHLKTLARMLKIAKVK